MVTCPTCGEENPAKFRLCGYCGAALAPALPPHEVRKTVTIVFSDLKGSTSLGEALDSEALREVMSRYFETMSAEIERHGGLIEKFIGDAIMAVFGLPTLHEDDALRAVKAAAGMQRALGALNADLQRRYGVALANRTGVNTGEVVAGDPVTGQRLVTGDPVNTAARLEQAAPADEILIGELTYRLVRDAVEVVPVEPLELKGKADRVPAYRLLAVRDVTEGRARRVDAPIVGRDAELGVLRRMFTESIAQNGPRMVTLVGDAGVGKSRLIREFVETAPAGVLVLRGHCLPYGEGITFWPIVEVARAAAGIRDDDPPEAARSKLLTLLGEREVEVRVASAAGLTAAQFPVSELFWGVRRFLEILGRRGPVIVVIEDIHWAEPTLLEFLDHVLDNLSEVPVLLLCSSRHELLEARADWGERRRAARIALSPLGDADSTRIVDNLLGRARLPERVRERIVGAAEGNPLFVEQMLSMLIDSGVVRREDGVWVAADEAGEIAVPPSIQALLAARLDQLGGEERALIEPASVIGITFPEPAVEALVPDPVRPDVPIHLDALTRKQVVHPVPPSAGEADSYRFQHLLIRDAAYNTLLKRTRATLHERFVAWADRVNADRQRALEFEEILGYHLEQAYRYRAELGPLDEEGIRVGKDAARRLSSAARRAYVRGDMHAAANLFRRATSLLEPHDPDRLPLLPYLAETLWELGELDEAERVIDATLQVAEELSDDVLAAEARLVRLFIENLREGAEGWNARVLKETEAAIPLFESVADHSGLARAYRLLTWVHGTECQYGLAVEAAERSLEHAKLAGDLRSELGGASSYALAAYLGPTPVRAAVARCEQIAAEARGDRGTEALVNAQLAQLLAMDGQFDRARGLIERARGSLMELGRKVLAAALATDSWRIEMLAGDPAAAERGLRRDIAVLESIGEKYFLSTVAAGLSHVLYAQGKLAEAESISRVAEELTGEDDVMSQVLWRSARAKIAGRGGRTDEALAFAADAVARARETDGPVTLADALADEAEVLALAGHPEEAGARLTEAHGLYRRKGDVVSTEAIARRMATTEPAEGAAT